MDSLVEIAGAAGALTTVFGGWKLGAWLLDMRQAKLEATQKENDAKRLALLEDRQGGEGRNTELIQRMQSMIDDLKSEIAALKKHYADEIASIKNEAAINLKGCEDREERLQDRVGNLEIYKARSSEYIRMTTSVYRAKIKGINLPDFTEEPTDLCPATPVIL